MIYMCYHTAIWPHSRNPVEKHNASWRIIMLGWMGWHEPIQKKLSGPTHAHHYFSICNSLPDRSFTNTFPKLLRWYDEIHVDWVRSGQTGKYLALGQDTLTSLPELKLNISSIWPSHSIGIFFVMIQEMIGEIEV